MVEGYGPSVFGDDREKDTLGEWGGKNAAAAAAAAAAAFGKGVDALAWGGGKLGDAAGTAWQSGGKAATWAGGKLGGAAGTAWQRGGEAATWAGAGIGSLASGAYGASLSAVERIRQDAARRYEDTKTQVAKAIAKGEWDKENMSNLWQQVDQVRRGTLAGTGLDPYYGAAASERDAKKFYTQAEKQQILNAQVADMMAEEDRRRREEGDYDDDAWRVITKVSPDNLGEPYKHHYNIEYTFT